jgi:peptidoglycan DL-endopeptidase CwlO
MNRRALAGIALGVAIVTAGACASSGVRPEPFPTPPTAPEPAPEPTPLSVPRGGATDGFTIATAALQLQGIPYRLGGTDVHGFDCSGLVQYVFALYGIALPRVVHDQYRVGRRIGVDDLEPGDLVFFDHLRHNGIYIGDGRFIHSRQTGKYVGVGNLDDEWYRTHWVGGRRL